MKYCRLLAVSFVAGAFLIFVVACGAEHGTSIAPIPTGGIKGSDTSPVGTARVSPSIATAAPVRPATVWRTSSSMYPLPPISLKPMGTRTVEDVTATVYVEVGTTAVRGAAISTDSNCGTVSWSGTTTIPNATLTVNPPTTQSGYGNPTWISIVVPGNTVPGIYQYTPRYSCSADSNNGSWNVSIAVLKLEILDTLNSGHAIQGTTYSRTAGKQVQLQAVMLPSGADVGPVIWTLPGAGANFVYSATRTLSSVSIYGVPLDWVQNQWYTTDSVSGTLTLESDRAGIAPAHATTQYVSDVPTGAQFTAQTSPPTILQGVGFELGHSGTPGISMSGTAKLPSDGPGNIAGIQLEQSSIQYCEGTTCTYAKDANGVQFIQSNGYYLDSCTLYAAAMHGAAGSAPQYKAVDYPSSTFGAGYNKVVRTDSFQHYLVYRPDGANSIFITLGVLTWGWSATVVQSANGTWSWQGTPTVSPVSFSATNHPLVFYSNYYLSSSNGSCPTEPTS